MAKRPIDPKAQALKLLARREHGARELMRKLKARGIGKILLVTSALHMPRAMAAFSKQGVQAIAAPTPPQIVAPADGSLPLWLPDQRTFDASRSIIKEYAGLFVYWLRGWV